MVVRSGWSCSLRLYVHDPLLAHLFAPHHQFLTPDAAEHQAGVHQHKAKGERHTASRPVIIEPAKGSMKRSVAGPDYGPSRVLLW